MGDRGNIVVKDGEGLVWLYSHWNGSSLPAILADALALKERWEDASYLTRIIFCRMVKGQEDDTTGYGISTRMGDNEHNILVVDVDAQKVLVCDEGKLTKGSINNPLSTYTFDEFIATAKEGGIAI